MIEKIFSIFVIFGTDICDQRLKGQRDTDKVIKSLLHSHPPTNTSIKSFVIQEQYTLFSKGIHAQNP